MPVFAFKPSNGQGRGFIAREPDWAHAVGWGNQTGTVPYGPFPSDRAASLFLGQQGGLAQVKGRPAPPKKSQGVPGAAIVAEARTWLGVPYLFGGTTRRGVDCSGLVMNVAHAVGIMSCPRTSEAQWGWCQHIAASAAGAGDLVFFVGAEIDPPPGHVGIIVSPGTMIDAPFTGTVVRYDHYSAGTGVNTIIGYGRMRGATGAGKGGANPNITGPPGAGGNQGPPLQAGGGAGGGIGAELASSVGVFLGIVILALIFVLLLAVALIFWKRA